MTRKAKQYGSQRGQKLNLFAVVGLLFLYIFSSQINSVHLLFHEDHEEEQIHSPSVEKDLCHRSIYHQDKEACDHKAHLVKQEKCELCHIHFITDHFYSFALSNRVKWHFNFDNLFLKTSLDHFHLDLFLSRAPPIIASIF